jgi:hypothetical protein
MREAVGAGNHKTVTAMVMAADAMWDAQGSHDPTVAATMTQWSRSPAPNNIQHSQLLRPQGSQVRFTLCIVGKLNCCRTPSGSAAIPIHATATPCIFQPMHFPHWWTDKW